MRRYEIILDDLVVGVWSGETKVAALDAYARSQGYDDFDTASRRALQDKRVSVIAVGSRPVIIEDEPQS